jgi:hypothetical protein
LRDLTIFFNVEAGTDAKVRLCCPLLESPSRRGAESSLVLRLRLVATLRIEMSILGEKV